MGKETPYVQGIVPLSYVANSFYNEVGDFSQRNYERILQLAIDALIDLNIYDSQRVDVAYLRMNNQGIVDLRQQVPDFIDYVKIGINVGGKLYVLGQNKKIIQPRDEIDDATAAGIMNGHGSNSDIDGGYYFAPHYHHGTWVGELYGMGGGFSRGYYRVDYEKGVIQFDSLVPSNREGFGKQIILEYVSTGVKPSGQTLVRRTMVPVIRAYIGWKMNHHDLRVPLNQKMYLKQEYLEEQEKFHFSENAPTIEEYTQMLYSTYRQTPKR